MRSPLAAQQRFPTRLASVLAGPLNSCCVRTLGVVYCTDLRTIFVTYWRNSTPARHQTPVFNRRCVSPFTPCTVAAPSLRMARVLSPLGPRIHLLLFHPN